MLSMVVALLLDGICVHSLLQTRPQFCFLSSKQRDIEKAEMLLNKTIKHIATEHENFFLKTSPFFIIYYFYYLSCYQNAVSKTKHNNLRRCALRV